MNLQLLESLTITLIVLICSRERLMPNEDIKMTSENQPMNESIKLDLAEFPDFESAIIFLIYLTVLVL